MRTIKIILTCLLISATLFLIIVVKAHAQVVPAQNQIIPSAYFGQGYVISTSTSPTHKLGASLVDLAGSFITGLLGVVHGGTGSSTLTGILKGNGTSAVGTAVGNTDYQLPISLTTSGSSGAATFNGTVLNIPQYTGGTGGTGNVATSSSETSGRVPFWTSTGATPATLSGGVSAFAFDSSLSKLTVTNASTTNLSIGSLSGMLKAASGIVSTATNGTDYTLISALSCGAGNHFSAITAAGVLTCSADTGASGSSKWATSTDDTAAIYPAGATKVGIGTTTPYLPLDVQGGIYSGTAWGTGTILPSSLAPIAGDESRFIWYPQNGTLVAGEYTTSVSEANIGDASAIFGIDNTASGYADVVGGSSNTITSDDSTAFGHLNTVSGIQSAAFGRVNTVSAPQSVAFGKNNTISGNFGEGNLLNGIGNNATNSPTYSFITGNSNELGGVTDANIIGNGNHIYSGASDSLVAGNNNILRYNASDNIVFGDGNDLSGSSGTSIGNNNDISSYGSRNFGSYLSSQALSSMVIGTGFSNTSRLTNTQENSLYLGFNSSFPTLFVSSSTADGLTGRIGIASTSPYAKVSIHALNGETNKTLFAIGSSTASATSTLFSVSNTGSIFTVLSNGCVQAASGILTSTGAACGAGGGGSGGGTWSTTTSSVAGELTNYPNNDTDIVSIGANSTTTAKFYFDPNGNGAAYFKGQEAHFGTTTSNLSAYCGLAGQPCWDFVAENNSDLGVVVGLENKTAGDKAFTGITFANDLSVDGSLNHLAFLAYTSSIYNSNTYGDLLNRPSALNLGSFEGPVNIISSGAGANGYVSIAAGGTSASDEVLRVDNAHNVLIGTTTNDSIYPAQDAKLVVDAKASPTENVIQAYNDINDFSEINCQNFNAGNAAQCGFSATRNDGNLTGNFIWMGANSTGFWNPTAFNVGGPGDGTILSDLNDLFIAQGTSGRKTHILNGGVSTSTNEVLTLATTSNSTNVVGIGTTSPFANLSVYAAGGYSTTTTLFAIGSSTTAGAISTLLSVNNIGSTTLFQIPSTVLTTNANGTIVGTSTVGVAYGGTGLNSVSDGRLLYGGGGTNALVSLATSTGGYLGESYTTGRPVWNATSTIFGTGTGGQVLTWNNGVPQFVATTTYSAPLVFSGGNLTITTASAGVTGALSGTDWSTFNNKQATISATWPIILTGATVSFGGLGTTTSLTQGQIPYVTGVNTFGQVATSSLTISGPFAVPANTSIIGTGGGVTYWGLATTSQPSSSNLLVSNGAAGVYGVATTSETCTGVVSCTAHTVLAGGGAVTITGGSNGQILGWSGGVPTWLGTTTAGTGLTYNGGSPGNFSVNTIQSITKLSNLTSNGFVQTSGGDGTLSIQAFPIPYADGGSNAATSWTQGSVLFAGASAFAQNNSNFFWDNSLNSLDIGTTSTKLGVLTLASTSPQFFLSSGAGFDMFYQANERGNFFMGTSSLSATSTNTLFSIVPNSTSNATTTFNVTDFVLKQTSAVAFSIRDLFNTEILRVNTASTTGSIFTVAATTSPSLDSPVKLFDVDQYGHLTASSTGATPTVSACGTSPTLSANANDVTGTIVAGTASPAACTLTFAHAYATTPTVVISDNSTTITADVSAVSTTAFTVSLSTGLSSVNISYIVVQP
jgi:hypothetical protein